jgi:hypothetical protein
VLFGSKTHVISSLVKEPPSFTREGVREDFTLSEVLRV